ncbi:hypothetical protein XENORESO_005631, partial [Xenotaenia resolanae]
LALPILPASSPGPNITLEGQYHCYQGPPIPMDKLCDFSTDCPLGDDEGTLCRHFLNGSYCSFEEGDCSWQPVPGRSLSWRRSPCKGTRQSCPSSGTTLTLEGGQSKPQRDSALLKSPLFPPPLRNSLCTVRFWFCSGGSQRDSLSLWIVENSTGPDEQRRLWHSASEPKSERGWRLITLPLYGLADWFWLLFSAEDGPGPGSAISLDNISFSMDCFLACNGFLPSTIFLSGDERLHALCPVRALRIYVEKTADSGKSEQLFVSWASSYKRKPLTKLQQSSGTPAVNETIVER